MGYPYIGAPQYREGSIIGRELIYGTPICCVWIVCPVVFFRPIRLTVAVQHNLGHQAKQSTAKLVDRRHLWLFSFHRLVNIINSTLAKNVHIVDRQGVLSKMFLGTIARVVSCNLIVLQPETREHFLKIARRVAAQLP